MEDAVVVVGLIAVQFMYAATAIMLTRFLKLGLRSFHLIVFANFATFLVLFPLALIFERSRWPSRINAKLGLQLFVLSFGGVTVYQTLFMKGVELTSPAIATAMPNLAPGLVFLVAWVFRLERVKLGCLYSKAKIAGTLLCVFGAVVMSLMQSSSSSSSDDYPTASWFDEKKISGSLYLIASVVVLSINVVLQAVALTHLPAPISLCCAISLLGVAITVVVQMMRDRTTRLPDWPPATMQQIAAYSVL
ncbi:mtn21-like protein, partial [Genlisea aurea]